LAVTAVKAQSTLALVVRPNGSTFYK
jgi:hypothetical protein